MGWSDQPPITLVMTQREEGLDLNLIPGHEEEFVAQEEVPSPEPIPKPSPAPISEDTLPSCLFRFGPEYCNRAQ
ncbi:hypothetical protein JHK87_044635 [Glycine soja]|nr:hypothetical protein JHK87_044635 [Glycine soja]